jgi:hypothetical protein
MLRKIFAHTTTASLSVLAGWSIPKYLDMPLNFLPPLFFPSENLKVSEPFVIDIGAMELTQTLAACSTVALCYWKGIGFADIAYATRRSVQDLKTVLLTAKKQIINRINGVEQTLNRRADRLDDKIVREAVQIRLDIDALHNDQTTSTESVRGDIRDLTSTVHDMDKKVTKIETLTTLSSRGVSILCGTMVPKTIIYGSNNSGTDHLNI